MSASAFDPDTYHDTLMESAPDDPHADPPICPECGYATSSIWWNVDWGFWYRFCHECEATWQVEAPLTVGIDEEESTMDDRISEVADVIGMLEEIGTIVRSWDDPYLNAYVLAELEGQDGGWLGEFAKDRIVRYHARLQNDLADVPFHED